MHLARAGAALFSITLCLPASAQVIDACVKNDGSLRIVSSPTDCRSKESPISWNATGQEGPQGPIGEQGPAGNNLWVVDGNGATVGQLVDLDIHDGSAPYLTFYLASVQAVAEVRFHDGKLGETGTSNRPTLYFTEPDCQGMAYTTLINIGIVMSVTVDNVTRYFVDRPGQENAFVQVSKAQNGDCSSVNQPSLISGVPAENVTGLIDVTFPLQLPLTVVSDGN